MACRGNILEGPGGCIRQLWVVEQALLAEDPTETSISQQYKCAMSVQGVREPELMDAAGGCGKERMLRARKEGVQHCPILVCGQIRGSTLFLW